MIQGYKIDENGFYIEPVLFNDSVKDFPSDIILKNWQDKRLYRPKFDYEMDDWVEGMPQKEIDHAVEKTRIYNQYVEAKLYLQETDWYVMRKIETGEEIPGDVAIKREESREIVQQHESTL